MRHHIPTLLFRDYLTSQRDKKFLLVIDNLWASDFHFWEMLRVPLLVGGDGSKVLITTRYERACHIPERIDRPSLTGLKDEDCWQLIQSLALPQGIDCHMGLIPIGEEIARRCYGSPMAAKALGAVLNRTSADEWSSVLSEMQALKDDFNGVVLASLKISYHHLRYHLKQCFGYCSIFPNGYVFERDQVVRYWMAEGLIEPEGRRRLEAVGMKYFDDLLWRSFFEKVPICDKGQIEHYRIPSLMHNLASIVSEYEFRGLQSGKRVLESNGAHQAQVRYASFIQPSDKRTLNLECIEPYSNLRALKFSHECNNGVVLLNSTPAHFFCNFMYLRVLDMSDSDLEQVPDSVGKLIHLRFLGLSYTKIKTLPEEICGLSNLQTLELKGCSQLESLPEGLQRLINLRHLDFHLDWEDISDSTEVAIPQGIGELEDLQTLSRFNVASAKGQQCNILELKDLKLRGDLCILNLEKVPTGHAKNANLQGKNFIEKLMLRWHSSALTDGLLQQQSEEHLPWLLNLRIENVHGDTMSLPEGFPSLEDLTLLNLNFLGRLTLGNEMPKLKKLYVSDCSKLQELVIHRNLYDKFERGNLLSSLRIICVPQD
ncbi:NBS-LRR-like resistance protein [Rhynchospora pubera]|uniref:NBS-LRR-like resistance protein n=1 Tax=Rhynchospora pubera TaxID=906938 RepID=A0AAV8D8L5_9POAL|nr:NBS-LRR-like resistance protein [Rhynchospora pubera]